MSDLTEVPSGGSTPLSAEVGSIQNYGTAVLSGPTPQEETKPGVKTTEFWVTIFTIIGLLVNVLPAPQSKEGLYSVIVGGLYVVSRGLAKLGVANVARAFGATDAEAELPGGITDAQRAAL